MEVRAVSGPSEVPVDIAWSSQPLRANSATLSLTVSSHAECLGPESSQDCDHDRKVQNAADTHWPESTTCWGEGGLD